MIQPSLVVAVEAESEKLSVLYAGTSSTEAEQFYDIARLEEKYSQVALLQNVCPRLVSYPAQDAQARKDAVRAQELAEKARKENEAQALKDRISKAKDDLEKAYADLDKLTEA